MRNIRILDKRSLGPAVHRKPKAKPFLDSEVSNSGRLDVGAFLVHNSLSVQTMILSWSVLVWVLIYEIGHFSKNCSVKWCHHFNLSSLNCVGIIRGES
jgi:hypothetical protein